jgi:hypothetical protein
MKAAFLVINAKEIFEMGVWSTYSGQGCMLAD